MDSTNLVINKPYYIQCCNVKEVKDGIKYCKELGYRWSDKRSGVMGKNHKFKYLFLFKGDVWGTFKEGMKDIQEANATEIKAPKIETRLQLCMKNIKPYIGSSVIYGMLGETTTLESVLSKYIKD